MLALATHEPHFSILREVVTINNTNTCNTCGQAGHYAASCPMKTAVQQEDNGVKGTTQKPYQFLCVNVLREYLAHDLAPENPIYFDWSLERAIDDFVFLCFFVGNDFLPHLPTLEIRENAIDLLVNLYKTLLPEMGGFVTDGGEVDLSKAKALLIEVGKKEESILVNRRIKDQRFKERKRRERYQKKRAAEREAQFNEDILESGRQSAKRMKLNEFDSPHSRDRRDEASDRDYRRRSTGDTYDRNRSDRDEFDRNRREDWNNRGQRSEERDGGRYGRVRERDRDAKEEDEANQRAAEKLKAELFGDIVPSAQPEETVSQSTESQTTATGPSETQTAMTTDLTGAESTTTAASKTVDTATARPTAHGTASNKKNDDDSEDEPPDDVRLGESGWKERYYRRKFNVGLDDLVFRRQIATSYAEGLVWVFRYYYQGCCSWKWYYPYHYPPFADDIETIDDSVDSPIGTMEKGTPFKPFEQLMGVLPAGSGSCLPSACWQMMKQQDSPILDFYPEDFPLDFNGKKFAWQAVALLPFIDEKRLLTVSKNLEPSFTAEEKERNRLGTDVIFVHESHPFATVFGSLYSGDEIPPLPAPSSGDNKQGEEEEEGEKEKPQEKVLTTHGFELDPERCLGVRGFIAPDPKFIPLHTLLDSGIAGVDVGQRTKNSVLSAVYLLPYPPPGTTSTLLTNTTIVTTKHHPPAFTSQLLPGCVPPPSVLTPDELSHRRNFRINSGAAGRMILHAAMKDGPGQLGVMPSPEQLRHARESYDAPHGTYQQHNRGGRGGYHSGGYDNRNAYHNNHHNTNYQERNSGRGGYNAHGYHNNRYDSNRPYNDDHSGHHNRGYDHDDRRGNRGYDGARGSYDRGGFSRAPQGFDPYAGRSGQDSRSYQSQPVYAQPQQPFYPQQQQQLQQPQQPQQQSYYASAPYSAAPAYGFPSQQPLQQPIQQAYTQQPSYNAAPTPVGPAPVVPPPPAAAAGGQDVSRLLQQLSALVQLQNLSAQLQQGGGPPPPHM
eukprot:TRINITY_DN6948_c0_g1_i2.p1 TRINITY_DN6948_c0_g1~~TRINITY_DN6948_c0_g1_i2.p1  ORF type:complete len:1005 (-),score=169.56 TRINITY_DN6948_c0_g1_i2:66-3080(-)